MSGRGHANDRSSAAPAGAPPSGIQLVGAVVRAFNATKDAPESAKCVLRSKTAQRGFRGECRTTRWCCPLSALCEFLLGQTLVAAPRVLADDDADSARLTIFVPLAVEVICWDQLSDAGELADLLPHLRYALASAGPRVGMALAAAGGGVPGFLRDCAWADPSRRAEPLRNLFERSGCRTKSRFADELGWDRDTVTRWLTHGGAPTTAALRDLGTYFEQKIAEADAAGVERELRWHYALADLGDRISARLGRAAVTEAASVFCAIVACAARRMTTGAFSHETLMLNAVCSNHRLGDAQCLADHAAMHGATPEFIADALAASAAWRGVLSSARREDLPPEFALLFAHLPRSGGRGTSRDS